MSISPSVCIIIPTYNQSVFIQKAVESALLQDYRNLEVVVADDNSNDATKAILQPYIDQQKIRYYSSKSNLGRVANYQCALQQYTTANWVINLDGDDFFTNASFVTKAIESIQDAGIDDVIFFQGVNIFQNKKKSTTIYPRIKEDEMVISGTAYFNGYFSRNSFSHMATLYNRQAAITSGFYEHDVLSSDVYSILQLCLTHPQKKAIVSKLVSGVWLQHEGNSSKSLKLQQHFKNFFVLSGLFIQSIKKGLGFFTSILWFLKLCIFYLRLYTSLLKRKFV
ncbi:MAG: glycosyltransferase family 2 protein [Ferruginibacter sp.]